MSVKKRAAERTSVATRVWFREAAATEGSPILVADLRVFRRWRGAVGESPTDYDRVAMKHDYEESIGIAAFGDDPIALFDTEGGGPVDVGVTKEDVVVLMSDGDYDENPKRLAKLLALIESRKTPEYLVGEIALTRGIVVADSALSGSDTGSAPVAPPEPVSLGAARFFVPRPAGAYVLVEGLDEADDGVEARWVRVEPRGTTKYERRPPAPKIDPVASVLERIFFADPAREARALEAALELVKLGRADLALEICAKASPARHALMSFTRVVALSASNDSRAQSEAVALADEWLLPRTPRARSTSASRARTYCARSTLRRSWAAGQSSTPRGLASSPRPSRPSSPPKATSSDARAPRRRDWRGVRQNPERPRAGPNFATCAARVSVTHREATRCPARPGQVAEVFGKTRSTFWYGACSASASGNDAR